MTNQITVFNGETNEIIVREMTEQELTEHNATILDAVNRKNETLQKKLDAKNALIALGLTEEIANQIAGVSEQSISISATTLEPVVEELIVEPTSEPVVEELVIEPTPEPVVEPVVEEPVVTQE